MPPPARTGGRNRTKTKSLPLVGGSLNNTLLYAEEMVYFLPTPLAASITF